MNRDEQNCEIIRAKRPTVPYIGIKIRFNIRLTKRATKIL